MKPYAIKALWQISATERARSGSVRFGFVRRELWMLPFHNVVSFSIRIGLIRFCSARLALQCEWSLIFLANPCTTRPTSQTTRRDEKDTMKVKRQSAREERRDRTCRDRRGAIQMEKAVRIPEEVYAEHTYSSVRLGSALFGWDRLVSTGFGSVRR